MPFPRSQYGDLSYFLNFFERTANLFVILSILGALISLLPSFLDIVIGHEWLHILLSSLWGFYTLIFLLVASYLGIFFMFLILIFIIRSFYHEVLQRRHCSTENKIIFSFVILVGCIAVCSVILFLFFSWITKFDYAIKFSFLIITLIFIWGFLIGFLSLLFYVGYRQIETIRMRRIASCLFGVGLIVLLSIVTFFLLPTFFQIPNYYSDKNIGVKVESNPVPNETPLIISLSYSLSNVTGNLTFFDVNYVQCHWSTNSGYFFTMDSKDSIIKKYDQELIIPYCSRDSNDQVYWTYDASEIQNIRNSVFIGLALEDVNNPVKILGSNNVTYNKTELNESTISFNSSLR